MVAHKDLREMLIKYVWSENNPLDRKGESQKKTADQRNLFLLILSYMLDDASEIKQ